MDVAVLKEDVGLTSILGACAIFLGALIAVCGKGLGPEKAYAKMDDTMAGGGIELQAVVHDGATPGLPAVPDQAAPLE